VRHRAIGDARCFVFGAALDAVRSHDVRIASASSAHRRKRDTKNRTRRPFGERVVDDLRVARALLYAFRSAAVGRRVE
jgi:hypothetical protein